MLFKVALVSALVSVVFGAALQQQVPIVSQTGDVSPDGSYEWSYQSGDGSAQQQSGQLKQIGDSAGEVVQGSASWTDPEGGQHQLTYVADENGYQPQSADIPVPPPIPQAILRALEWIAAHPQPQLKQPRY
ncbi:endocuticle structural glycoprotein SgAbd-3-like [Rhynchophorus ferrugineus]|uniref:Uncharacterized protein n=1 Tax=Rhynchophorus ferrugineus TaxID=354439 RepID=A0A834HQX9_RHYFE|nr:hypothetical protein GWI33_000708 [Rhynchophorus ferrugineus]KAF7264156.1 hypothetical protein GWI33_000567 [Rhynchophorus ferrugineus]